MTTGPGRTLMISPLTPKSSSTPSSRRAFCSSASSEIFEATGLLRLGEHRQRRQLVGVAVEQRQLRFARRRGGRASARRPAAATRERRRATSGGGGAGQRAARCARRAARKRRGRRTKARARGRARARAAAGRRAGAAALRNNSRRSALLIVSAVWMRAPSETRPKPGLAVAVLVVALVALRLAPQRGGVGRRPDSASAGGFRW